jgi:hypothetical protein
MYEQGEIVARFGSGSAGLGDGFRRNALGATVAPMQTRYDFVWNALGTRYVSL